MKVMMWAIAATLPVAAAGIAAQGNAIGQFIDHRDIGQPASPGEASYDPRRQRYRITAAGQNMWADRDDFHFAWKRMSGDVVATTRLDFVSPAPRPGDGGYLHRKGGIVLRQDLDPDSAYVDVLRMGNQQMSLQYREVKGGQTRLIWINTPRQGTVGLTKIGDYAYLSVLGADGKLHHAGGSFKIRITGPYYIGLGVCPHDPKARETMAFSDVRIAAAPAGTRKPGGTTLQTINIGTPPEQTVIHHSSGPVSMTGWSASSEWVHFSSEGKARRAKAWDSDVVETAPPPQQAARPVAPAVALGIARQVSPDGRSIAYLTGTPGKTPSMAQDVVLRLAPVVDGKPATDKAVELVKLWGNAASLPRSAWSPDGKTIAFISLD